MGKAEKYLISVEKKDYYTQRNNEIDSLVSCNVTSMVQAADIMGLAKLFPKSQKYTQPEDILRYRIERKKKDPTVHAFLSEGTNDFLKGIYTRFFIDNKVLDILKDIKAKRPVVLSGNFPYINSKGKHIVLGHINTLIGYETDKNGDLSKVTILDPFGNPLKNFKESGYMIELSASQFYNLYKPTESLEVKWGHRWLATPRLAK